MPTKRDAERRDDRGAAAVEFALVIIPLLLVIGGIINFGVVFAQQLALDNAVRAGARAGVVDTGTSTTDEVTTEFNGTVIGKSLITSPLAVSYPGASPTCEDSTFGQNLVVRGRLTTKFMIPWPVPGSVLPKSITLTSQAEFQCEFQ